MLGRRSTMGLAAFFAAGAVCAAPSQQDLDARVQRLEQLMDNQMLVEMLNRIERLQQDVQQLRGQMEEQGHALDGVQRRQRDLYLDVDRRLSQMEREGVPEQLPSAQANGTPAITPGVESPASAPTVEQEREAYQKAFDMLRALRYEQSVGAFRDFLKTYPDGRYAHIAQYWLGEANYAQRNFKQAIVEYQRLLEHHPKSPKLAEAMLKIGYSQNELGDRAATTKVLEDLIKRYPNTTEAGQARNLLQRLKREGNG